MADEGCAGGVGFVRIYGTPFMFFGSGSGLAHFTFAYLAMASKHRNVPPVSLPWNTVDQVLLPTYNILDGAQSLLEVHKVGRKLVGGFGVKAFLPRESGSPPSSSVPSWRDN